MNATEQYFRLFVCLFIDSVTIQMKAIEQYFHVLLYNAVQGGSNFKVSE